MGPLLLLLFLGRRHLAGTLRGGAAAFAAFTGLSLLLMVVVRMPSVNENKMIILYFCMAAPFAAPGAMRLHSFLARRSAGRALWFAMVILALLVPATIWTGY